MMPMNEGFDVAYRMGVQDGRRAAFAEVRVSAAKPPNQVVDCTCEPCHAVTVCWTVWINLEKRAAAVESMSRSGQTRPESECPESERNGR